MLTLDPNSPPAEVEAEVFAWPKRLPEPPLVAGLPNENGAPDFAGSDMVFEKEGVALGLGGLSAVGLRRRLIDL